MASTAGLHMNRTIKRTVARYYDPNRGFLEQHGVRVSHWPGVNYNSRWRAAPSSPCLLAPFARSLHIARFSPCSLLLLLARSLHPTPLPRIPPSLFLSICLAVCSPPPLQRTRMLMSVSGAQARVGPRRPRPRAAGPAAQAPQPRPGGSRHVQLRTGQAVRGIGGEGAREGGRQGEGGRYRETVPIKPHSPRRRVYMTPTTAKAPARVARGFRPASPAARARQPRARRSG